MCAAPRLPSVASSIDLLCRRCWNSSRRQSAWLALSDRQRRGRVGAVNDRACWVWLQDRPAKAARWVGYVPFDRIHDARNEYPIWDAHGQTSRLSTDGERKVSVSTGSAEAGPDRHPSGDYRRAARANVSDARELHFRDSQADCPPGRKRRRSRKRRRYRRGARRLSLVVPPAALALVTSRSPTRQAQAQSRAGLSVPQP
jgi:hypothetical protein